MVAGVVLVTKLLLGHANVFEALLRQRGIRLESRSCSRDAS
jgi:hypothetical protein